MSGPVFERGDIIIAQTPHSNQAAVSQHPALIVGDPLANSHGDYVLIQITSTRWNGATDVVLADNDPEFASSGLQHTSTFRCHKLFALAESKARRKIGSVGPITLKKIESKLRLLLQL